jgi:hypothetical protein
VHGADGLGGITETMREKWGDDPERYREIGLDYPKG